MEKKYILALDEGTTSARSILFDRSYRIVAIAQHEIRQSYPRPGWVEQDPMEIYASQYASMTECIAKSGISPEEIACIGITNQRETTVVWDRQTGKPIHPAIVWQCRRTADICEKLIREGHSDYIESATGLRPDAYFSGTKIRYILDHVDGAEERAKRGELLFGTIDTWLLYKLTDGRIHVTDRTNASRTMLYHLERDDWDEGMLRMLSIPRTMLPRVCSSSEIYDYVELMGTRIPISGIAGDQQAALFGQRCFGVGDTKVTYGTGCFLLTHTGNRAVRSRNGLLTTAAATEKGRPSEFALEGSVFTGGAIVKWLRDQLGLISDARDSEYFASKVTDSAGVYVVPALSGLGAPYWNMQARGTILGLSGGSGRNHIIRAALESIAYQTNDLLSAMEQDLGERLTSLRADGGASANKLLMQFQADISNLRLFRPHMMEQTALGAALLAGLGVGFFDSRESLSRQGIVGDEFTPQMEEERRTSLLDGWQCAVTACNAFSAKK